MQNMYEEWLNNVTAAEKAELYAIADNAKEIEERFYTELQFGTAGMRGEVGMGTFRMNVYTVRRATAGLASYISSLGQEARDKGVVISYDTRRFSLEFAVAVAEVLSAYKVKGYLFENVRPVPMCSFAIRYYGAMAGVMITASHNPKEYNGYKVYGEDGAQMGTEDTAGVVNYIKKFTSYFNIPYNKLPNAANFGGKDNYKIDDYITVIGATVDEEYYNKILKLSLSPQLTAKYGNKIKLVYTPVHGAGYVPVTTIFNKLGIKAEVVEAQRLPDTEFSTVKVPNPESPETLKMGMELGTQIGADVVLATDPDCDRLGVAVKNTAGEFVLLTGNQIGVLLLDYILTRKAETNTLPQNAAIVRSFVTTTLADAIAADYSVASFSVLTGFKYIGEKIKEWEVSGEYSYIFGFEESYGSLCGTHARDKDAVVASMLFAEMLIYHQTNGITVYQRLIQIFNKYGYYLEKNESINYKGISGMSDMAKVMAKLRAKSVLYVASERVNFSADYSTQKITYANGTVGNSEYPATDAVYLGLNEGQFICIRPSGTEPKLKLYVLIKEKDYDSAALKAERLINAIKMELQ